MGATACIAASMDHSIAFAEWHPHALSTST